MSDDLNVSDKDLAAPELKHLPDLNRRVWVGFEAKAEFRNFMDYKLIPVEGTAIIVDREGSGGGTYQTKDGNLFR